jgi:hypothetical protein
MAKIMQINDNAAFNFGKLVNLMSTAFCLPIAGQTRTVRPTHQAISINFSKSFLN